MNVAELKNALEEFDDNMEVVFSYDYGDRSHSSVAQAIEQVEEERVKWSEYHQMDTLYDYDLETDFSKTRAVVVLS